MIIIGYYAMDQVPLSLWAAWGIYSEPIRYRSLFPHNEARKQAIAGLSQSASRHCLLIDFDCYFHYFSFAAHSSLLSSFLPIVGEWKTAVGDGRTLRLPLRSRHRRLRQAQLVGATIIRVPAEKKITVENSNKWDCTFHAKFCRILKFRVIASLKQFVRTFCLFLICVKVQWKYPRILQSNIVWHFISLYCFVGTVYYTSIFLQKLHYISSYYKSGDILLIIFNEFW